MATASATEAAVGGSGGSRVQKRRESGEAWADGSSYGGSKSGRRSQRWCRGKETKQVGERRDGGRRRSANEEGEEKVGGGGGEDAEESEVRSGGVIAVEEGRRGRRRRDDGEEPGPTARSGGGEGREEGGGGAGKKTERYDEEEEGREAAAMVVSEQRPSWVVGEEMGKGGTVTVEAELMGCGVEGEDDGIDGEGREKRENRGGGSVKDPCDGPRRQRRQQQRMATVEEEKKEREGTGRGRKRNSEEATKEERLLKGDFILFFSPKVSGKRILFAKQGITIGVHK